MLEFLYRDAIDSFPTKSFSFHWYNVKENYVNIVKSLYESLNNLIFVLYITLILINCHKRFGCVI